MARPTTTQPAVRPGETVEVWCGLTDGWTDGFAVDAVSAAGVRIRRQSDNSVLPVVFSDDQIRSKRERRQSDW